MITKLQQYNISPSTEPYNKYTTNYEPWCPLNIEIDDELQFYQKSNTNKQIYKVLIKEKLETKYKNALQIYTDGSKIGENTGCAVKVGPKTWQYRLKNEVSIHSAELYAIYKAIKNTEKELNNNILICTDSSSAIQTIKQLYTKNATAIQIKNEIHKNKNKKYTLLWIPGHSGIKENEEVDLLAKASLNNSIYEKYKITLEDTIKIATNRINEKWATKWQNQNTTNKLKQIKNGTQPWTNLNKLSRLDAIKITRMRIGHTRLTHEFLIRKRSASMQIS